MLRWLLDNGTGRWSEVEWDRRPSYEYHITYDGEERCSIFATKSTDVSARAKPNEWVVECYPVWHHDVIRYIEPTEAAAVHRLVAFVVRHENAIRDEMIRFK